MNETPETYRTKYKRIRKKHRRLKRKLQRHSELLGRAISEINLIINKLSKENA